MIVSGRQIRTVRARLGWSQTDLGRAAGLHRNAVGYWERHETIPSGGYREPVGVVRMREAFERAGIRFSKARDLTTAKAMVERPLRDTQVSSCAQAAGLRSTTQSRKPACREAKRECGARTRKGYSCKRPPYGNGRCRNHGGLSTGPTTEEGKQRCAEAAKRRWAAYRQKSAGVGTGR